RDTSLKLPESGTFGPGPTAVFCGAVRYGSFLLTRWVVYPWLIVVFLGAVLLVAILLVRVGSSLLLAAWRTVGGALRPVGGPGAGAGADRPGGEPRPVRRRRLPTGQATLPNDECQPGRPAGDRVDDRRFTGPARFDPPRPGGHRRCRRDRSRSPSDVRRGVPA